MDLTFFKDVLFDLINECEQFDILAIDAYDRENRFVVHTEDGRAFEVQISEVRSGEASAIKFGT